LASLLYVALDVLPSAFLFTGTTLFSFLVNPSLNYPLIPSPPSHSNMHILISLFLSLPPPPNRCNVRL
jgi:hypothetical protein